MTSPNQEAGIQQAGAEVQAIIRIKARALLEIRKQKTVNLVGREQAEENVRNAESARIVTKENASLMLQDLVKREVLEIPRKDNPVVM